MLNFKIILFNIGILKMIIVNDKQLKTLIVKKEHILKMHTQKISTSKQKIR